MKQQLVAGLMSLGIAFTGVTAPTASRADTRDVALIVGSAIALFALKEVLEDKDKKKKSSTTYSSRNRQKDDALYYKNGRGHAYGHDKKNKKGKKGKDRKSPRFLAVQPLRAASVLLPLRRTQRHAGCLWRALRRRCHRIYPLPARCLPSEQRPPVQARAGI